MVQYKVMYEFWYYQMVLPLLEPFVKLKSIAVDVANNLLHDKVVISAKEHDSYNAQNISMCLIMHNCWPNKEM